MVHRDPLLLLGFAGITILTGKKEIYSSVYEKIGRWEVSRMFRNVVLVGFMGTGKTTVGRLLAERLGWTFVDSDYQVEEKAGMSIPELFAAKGEPYFRELETEALRTLLSGKHFIVSTGGGAVLKEENRQLMLEGGFTVALRANEETIVARVRGDSNRPLLQGNVEERVHTLMETRRNAYDFALLQIDTDRITVSEIVDRIIKNFQP
jgi:shikimate kinase